jgi:hypothetical protein
MRAIDAGCQIVHARVESTFEMLDRNQEDQGERRVVQKW